MPFRGLSGVTQCRFKRGDVLIHAGEQVEYVYYLLKGTVQREMLTKAGYESILGIKAGEGVVSSLVGILVFYRPKEPGVSRYNFIASTNCVCYRIPKDVCMQYLRRRPDLLESLVYTAMEEYNYLMDLFQAKREGGVAASLCAFLLEHSHDTEEGRIVAKKYSNVEISKFLSVHKVTVARVLRVLKEQGCVTRTPKGLLLQNVALLTEYAQQEKPLDYKYVADHESVND